MEEPTGGPQTPFDHLRRYVPLLAWVIVILTLLAIPLKITSYGYLPGDDALRHAAKAVSDKPWSEIMVLNDVYKIDHEFGWNLLLEKCHRWFGWDADSLVIFSVTALFLLVSASVIPWLKRPEAWLAILILVNVMSGMVGRFMLGRPYLVTISGLMTILLLWQRFGSAPPKVWMAIFMFVVIAACTFVHGVWYLWVLLIGAFFFSGQFRWCFTLAGCWIAGILLGSALTGHPIGYPVQALKLAFLAVGTHATGRTMAGELQPSTGDIFALCIFAGLLILRQFTKLNPTVLLKNPAFWMMIFGWILSFKVGRFWDDWGWPALMILLVVEIQWALLAKIAFDSFQRLGVVCLLAITGYMSLTADYNSRWTSALLNQYLTQDNPDLKDWMPKKNGVFYSADMTLFYQTFFKNPKGDWRYMLGFEPTWMPKEDFEIYHSILWNFGDAKAYKPWVEKMQPADRLVIRGGRGSPPGIGELEWNYGVSGIWIGRLPRIDTNGAPVTVPATITRTNAVNSTP